MTGYASAQHEGCGAPAQAATQAPQGAAAGGSRARRLGLEIRSVNSRFLDLTLRLPDELRAAEPALRALLAAGLKRGKVELRVLLDGQDDHPLQDPPARLLQRLAILQDSVRIWLPGAAALTVADALQLCASAPAGPAQDWSGAVTALAQQVLADLLAAREREGRRLAAALLERSAQLRALARQAAPLLPAVLEQQRQRFMQRWQEALALAGAPRADSEIAGARAAPPQAAHERALGEAAAFALRMDVAEELTRLESHLSEIERLIAQGGEVGKRLDFLIQELQREANTLGAKSGALELTRIGVDMKVLIEQMREQVQNLE